MTNATSCNSSRPTALTFFSFFVEVVEFCLSLSDDLVLLVARGVVKGAHVGGLLPC